MTAQNLALVLTPSLLVAPPSTTASPHQSIAAAAGLQEIEVVRLLIQYQPEFITASVSEPSLCLRPHDVYIHMHAYTCHALFTDTQ